MNVREEELSSGKEQISTIARKAIPELEFPEADEVYFHLSSNLYSRNFTNYTLNMCTVYL